MRLGNRLPAWRATWLLLPLLLWLADGGRAEDQRYYKQVSPSELQANPKNFWSVGFIFKDALLTPPGGPMLLLGIKNYIPMFLRDVGTCYVDADVADEFAALALESDYLFAGTVLSKEASLFGRSQFYIIIQSATPAIGEVAIAQIAADGTMDSSTAIDIRDLLDQVQEDLYAYAQANQESIAGMFSRDFKNSSQITELIASAIGKVEREKSTSTLYLLTEMIRGILARQYGVEQAAPAPVTSKEPVAKTLEELSPGLPESSTPPAPELQAEATSEPTLAPPPSPTPKATPAKIGLRPGVETLLDEPVPVKSANP